MRVAKFDFDLPEDRIATHPCEPRDACKLLQVSKFFFDFTFNQLPDLLNTGDILVFNDSKVIPARLFGHRNGPEGAKVELLLHKSRRSDTVQDQASSLRSNHHEVWDVFLRPAKRLKTGDIIEIDSDFHAEILDKRDGGEATLAFSLSGDDFFSKLQEVGHMPLPPYIKRDDESADQSDYQTIYAREAGSVAAPTAGLHFTESLMAKLRSKGVKEAYVTLHVGAGTFQPVKVDDTDDHIMHSECATLSKDTAAAINTARAEGGKVIAVGTTSLRILESVARNDGTLASFTGETDIFITPGYKFKLVDRLVTNFHLPQSTLFMLVSAFSGLERMQHAYEHATRSGYRFYSYGDACLLDRIMN